MWDIINDIRKFPVNYSIQCRLDLAGLYGRRVDNSMQTALAHRRLYIIRRKTCTNDMLVGILGLAAIAATVISLTRGRMLPAMAFILWPSVLAMAMVAAGRCSFTDIEAMIRAGYDITAPIAALFVFSVLFFGIMTAALLLATGMANVTIRNHIKASALYVWSFAFLCLLFAILIGLVPL